MSTQKRLPIMKRTRSARVAEPESKRIKLERDVPLTPPSTPSRPSLVTPTTPRTRATPRTPCTPRKLTTPPRTPCTPRKPTIPRTPATPKTPTTPKPPATPRALLTPKTPRVYTPVKDALKHVDRAQMEALSQTKLSLSQTQLTKLVCRDDEIATIMAHVCSTSPGALVLAGLPGTGKTLCVRQVLESEAVKGVVHINCKELTKAVFITLARKLLPGSQCIGTVDQLKARLRQFIRKSKEMIVLVLDEIDELGMENLTEVFSWTSLPSSKLILIGISNVLNLSDRLLSRLQTKPKVIHFSPYVGSQLAAIIKERDVGRIFSPMAITYCAKVAADRGDVRRALDMCRMAVDKLEDNLRGENSGGNALSVTMRDMAEVVKHALSPDMAVKSLGEKLPLHQQLVVAAMLRLQGGRTHLTLDINKIFGEYKKICQMKNLKYLRDQEFRDGLNMLEGHSVIVLKRQKGLYARALLRLSKEELGDVLKEDMVVSLFM